MSDLLDLFEERRIEVNAYISFLETIDAQTKSGGLPRIDGEPNPISAQQIKILYSNVFLHLYNLIESTINNCLDAVTAAARENDYYQIVDLSANLRNEWVRSKLRPYESMNPEKKLKDALEMFDHLINALPVGIFELDSGGGGNWDDTDIEKISKRIGFDLKIKKSVYSKIKQKFKSEYGPLGLVKNYRNKLAHGSISFTQCSDNYTVSELKELLVITETYLEEVVKNFTTYLSTYEYLVPEKRPA